MLPLAYRDYDLFQSPYFYKKFKDRKADISYTHHYEFLKDFYGVFKNPEKSVLLNDPRPGNRYCDTMCVFKKTDGIYVCVTLKDSDGYYEMVNVMPANKWLKEIFDNKEELRGNLVEG